MIDIELDNTIGTTSFGRGEFRIRLGHLWTMCPVCSGRIKNKKSKDKKKGKCLTSWRKIERQKRRSIGGGRDPTGPGCLDDRWIDPLYWVAAHDDDDWQPKRKKKKNGARVRL